MEGSNVGLAIVERAVGEGKLSSSAASNIRKWLTETRYTPFAAQVVEQLEAGDFKTLDDVFWTVIPFGTGGRRGRMFPVGSNAINDRTIGESAQGLADYVKQVRPDRPDLSCAIAYDTRHRSRHFACLCAEIMAAAGFKVFLLDDYRSTPELSFAVRYKHADCGIMVTASHNPPSDNAVKVYWSNGGQLLPPHDEEIIKRVAAVEGVIRMDFDLASATGLIQTCHSEIDSHYHKAVLLTARGGPRDLKILYSPMHGVGASSVVPILHKAGFNDVVLFGPHSAPDGDFPNVPGHVANPENPATFDAPIAEARRISADLVLSTDPDADRLGCAAPVSAGGPWRTFTGNQIAALLLEYLLESGKAAGSLSPQHYVTTTLVTTGMIRRMADAYQVTAVDDLLVGFKWIAGEIEKRGAERFVFGAEESHGYLAGGHARDKDAAVAALLMSELAARLKAQRQTLHQKLDSLFWQYGCHAEKTISLSMPGSEGMADMRRLMDRFRAAPPVQLAGLTVSRIRDYEQRTVRTPAGGSAPLDGPKGDLVFLDLAEKGNYAAVRPSGTEPKIKIYLFTYTAPELLADLEQAKAALELRLGHLERDLRAFAC
jgi:phosphoglucomutase/phosphomannomutase